MFTPKTNSAEGYQSYQSEPVLVTHKPPVDITFEHPKLETYIVFPRSKAYHFLLVRSRPCLSDIFLVQDPRYTNGTMKSKEC